MEHIKLYKERLYKLTVRFHSNMLIFQCAQYHYFVENSAFHFRIDTSTGVCSTRNQRLWAVAEEQEEQEEMRRGED